MVQAASPRGLPSWAAELARLWNGGTHSLFLLHGNVFDIFPLGIGAKATYGPLTAFLARRLFPSRGSLLFYDVGDGLTFASPVMRISSS